MTPERARTVTIDNLTVDIIVRARSVVLVIMPPPNHPGGWFETTKFLHARPGQPVVVPSKAKLAKIVRKEVRTRRVKK